MLQLLQAGFFAARIQLGAVVTITLAALLLQPRYSIVQGTSEPGSHIESFRNFSSPFLIWSYLLVSAGLALTSGKHTELTAEHMRRASNRVTFASPKDVLKSLIVQLGLSTVAVAMCAPQPPPEPLIDAAKYFGCACTASAIWAAAMSICVAFFGASTRAAMKALGELNKAS